MFNNYLYKRPFPLEDCGKENSVTEIEAIHNIALTLTLAKKSCCNTMTMTSFSVLRIFKANNEEELYLPYLWSVVDWMAGCCLLVT